MMRNRLKLSFDRLPDELSVFPLPGVLLLPNGRLPLNIFEPRYLNMVLDSLREDRLIGMVQATELAPDPVPDDAELFKIGCVGKIVSFAETPDGRIQLVLDGICRFGIGGDFGLRNGYRRVSADYSQFQRDMDDPAQQLDRRAFRRLLESYFKAKQISVDWDMVDNLEDNFLIANLGMMCPFNAQEKQALLEARDYVHMTEIMMSLMEMAIQESAVTANDNSQVRH
tara:strand:- start:533 stop:1210 length:678 start_codon:yes stop_codon:yes gene_type:complete